MRKKLNGICILFLLLMLCACSSNSGTTTINMSDITGAIEEEQNQAVETFKAENKERFDKDYENGLYYEDFSEEEKLVSAAYEPIFSEKFNAYTEEFKNKKARNMRIYPEALFIRVEVDAFKQSMKNLREKTLSVEDILANESEHIKKIRITMYRLQDDRGSQDDWYGRLEEDIQAYNLKNIELEVITSLVTTDTISKDEFAMLSRSEHPQEDIIQYFPKGDIFQTLLVNGPSGVNGIDIETPREGVFLLELKYYEPFRFYSLGIDGAFYQSITNPEFVFQAKSSSVADNKYPTIRTQKMVTDRVKAIIESHDLQDKIVVFVKPKKPRRIDSPEHHMFFDFSKLNMDDPVEIAKEDRSSDLWFVNERYPNDTHIALYMILEEGEIQDEVLIKQLGEEIQELYPSDKNYVNVFLYVYRMDAEKREILVDLFKDKDRTENHFECGRNAALDFSSIYTTRTDHEGFRFLDVYGERDEYMYKYYPKVVNYSQEEFIEHCKNHDIWRD